ncbi:MAG: cation-translocating P-type ATPase [Lachnospiraceae bacterium]|nr:cation-translocating P-type ATPase [Lachnospiraceae bacterium]
MYQGLTTAQAQEAVRLGLSNIGVDNTARTTGQIIRDNVLTYFNLIFAVLTVLLVIAGSYRSLTFLPVVIANTLIGIIQQLRAKKTLDRLAVLNQPVTCAIRDGAECRVPSEQLVPDDVIVLKEGNQIPADAVVLDGEIAVNESLLTGEADEIEKTQGSELMSGSFVVNGRCHARLTKVGMDSYINRLSMKAKQMKAGEQSEMVKSINRFVIAAGIAIIPVGALLLYQSFSRNLSFADSVVSMVAAVIGMIPEGLYLLVSVTLVMSAMRLARNKVMLHDMKSTETLARVDILCVDKTGTITENRMRVTDAFLPGAETDEQAYAHAQSLIASYVASLPDDNATMQAIREYFQTGTRRRASETLPFSSKRKYSAVTFDDGTYVLGAPDIILRGVYGTYRDRIEEHAAKGLRVVALARVISPASGAQALSDSTGMQAEPVLFVLLENPLRTGAEETFRFFGKQGVGIRVISGDNPLTVSKVAQRAGIPGAEHFIDASAIESDEELDQAIRETIVFGRVTPEMKQRIIRALKRAGHTVAMTGDGVNDILAMKDADCSVAMAAGSDAAVQAAQVVLLDSDFSRMPHIVAEGRRDINNVERSASLFLVKNLFSLLLSVYTIASVRSYPLEPSQISLVSMFNIGVPAFFLAMEPNTRRVGSHFMRRVLIKAMPAALTAFIAIAAMVVFGEEFLVSGEDISIASTYLLAIVGFMILFRISAPLNRYRTIVITACIAGIILFSFVLGDLYAVSMVSKRCLMLFAVFAIATEPFMRYLTMLSEKAEQIFARDDGETRKMPRGKRVKDKT